MLEVLPAGVDWHFLWHALEGFYPNRIRVIPKRQRFPSQRPSRYSSHAHGDGLPQLPALPLLPLPPGNLFTSPQRQRPTPHGRRLTTYSDCDQALRYECVDRGSVMGHGCPLRPKQVNGSPRPPPPQRTLSVARGPRRGSLDKGFLVLKISRMRVQISRMRSRSAGYAANAALL